MSILGLKYLCDFDSSESFEFKIKVVSKITHNEFSKITRNESSKITQQAFHAVLDLNQPDLVLNHPVLALILVLNPVILTTALVIVTEFHLN